jgi:AcrR family transcriptional regulator
MSPRRELSERRRHQILKAAAEVVSEQGLCDTRIATVAERAGASPALVIYYFGTRDRLLAEALSFWEERFYTETARQLAELDSAREQLVRLIRLSCSAGKADGQNWLDEWVLWLDLWARAPRDANVARDREKLDRRWRETIAGIVRRGQQAGEFGPVDTKAFSLRLAALIDGLAIQVVLGDPEVPPERMFDLCMDSAARELGFAWTRQDRDRALAGDHGLGAPSGVARPRPAPSARPTEAGSG